MYFQKTLAALALTTLAACGGSSSGGGQFGASPDALFNSLVDLQSLQGEWAIASDDSVNNATGTADYTGFVNVGGGEELVGYLGQLAITADFSGDTVSGSAGNFYEYGETTITPGSTNPLGPAVAGSLSMSGTLTGTNQSTGIGGGIDGTFSGTVDGITESAGELSGMIMNESRSGITLYFNGENLLGVGIGAR